MARVSLRAVLDSVPRVPFGLRVPRPPVGPDPLRRVKVPRDLATVTSVGEDEDPRAGGMDRDGVERIWRGVEGLYRSGVHPAIQLCLRREGRVVLDRAIGHARPNVPVTTGTPFLIYSAAKAVTAMVAHLLDQRGDIHFGDRVAAVGRAEVTGAPVLPPLSTLSSRGWRSTSRWASRPATAWASCWAHAC